MLHCSHGVHVKTLQSAATLRPALRPRMQVSSLGGIRRCAVPQHDVPSDGMQRNNRALATGSGIGSKLAPGALALLMACSSLLDSAGPAFAQIQAVPDTATAEASALYTAPAQLSVSNQLAPVLAASAAALAPPASPETVKLPEPSVNTMKAPPQLETAMSALSQEELNNIQVFQANTPSVVNITNLRMVQRGNGYFNLDAQQIPAGVGSGFIWDGDGHVVTNFHVIRGASEVRVTLLDSSTYTAKVVGFDPDKDVAVLKLEVPADKQAALKPVTLGSSGDLLVGQKVFALGNPFGLDHTLTAGIISGVGRELNTGLSSIKNVIQTDAAINPGNSGGILMNNQGKVIGINTAIADPTGKGSSSGVGFAIPISDVKGLVDQILATGKVQRPALGLTIAPPQILQQLGVQGVLILDVPAGSPAAAAGLQPTKRDRVGRLQLGDIITGIDDRQVKSYKDLYGVLDDKKVGEKIKVELLRNERKVNVEVTLGERVLGQAE